MEGNQKIHCTVESCVYNNQEQALCTLKAIQVEPVQDCETCTPDESMCASYENNEQ